MIVTISTTTRRSLHVEGHIVVTGELAYHATRVWAAPFSRPLRFDRLVWDERSDKRKPDEMPPDFVWGTRRFSAWR